MAVQQQLMNTGWITTRETPIGYLTFIAERDHRRIGDRVTVNNFGGPENHRPFGGMRGTVVAIEPGGRQVELRIEDGSHVFHVALMADSTTPVSR
jgi:hypothetical protein